MSWETHTGLPYLSNESKKYYENKHSSMLSDLRHLAGNEDFKKLWIPNVGEYKKYDAKNPIHPVHLENIHANNQETANEEKLYRLECKYERDEVHESEYQHEMNQLELDKLNKLFYFGDPDNNVWPLEKSIKNKINIIKKEINKYGKKQVQEKTNQQN